MPGFSQSFAGDVAVKHTSIPYLRTLILYFVEGGYASTTDGDYDMDFMLASERDVPAITNSTQAAVQMPITIVDQPSEPSDRNDAFVLVAVNSQPGHGPAGTQEERLVGQSPALTIASLLTPVLAPDEAVITSPLPVHASWQCHGRQARMIQMYPNDERSRRRYTIADALPLDLEEEGSETSAQNVQREVRKLYAAFAGAKNAWVEEGKLLQDLRIEMPPWDCGAFGGTLSVKVPCMVMAAALAGLQPVNFELFAPRDRQEELKGLPDEPVSVRELFQWVTSRAS